MSAVLWGLSQVTRPQETAVPGSVRGMSTVNSALSAKQNGSAALCRRRETEGTMPGTQDLPLVLASSPGAGEGSSGVGKPPLSGAQGHPSRKRLQRGERGLGSPNQHSSSDVNGKDQQGGTVLALWNPATQPGSELVNSWAKAASSGPASEGNSDSSGSHHGGHWAGWGRRPAARQRGLLEQGHTQLPRATWTPEFCPTLVGDRLQ